METITVESIPIVLGREEDGRWWADIESMPGVMAYGATRESAISAVRALALRIAAEVRCIFARTLVAEILDISRLSRIALHKARPPKSVPKEKSSRGSSKHLDQHFCSANQQ